MIVNTRTYSLLKQVTPDISMYAGPAHTFSTLDQVQLSRVWPKGSQSNAVAKPLFKRTKTVSTGVDTKSSAIFTIGGSLPVGMTETEIDAGLADLAAFAASDDAKALFKKLVIGQ